jgi:hypothetical protein
LGFAMNAPVLSSRKGKKNTTLGFPFLFQFLFLNFTSWGFAMNTEVLSSRNGKRNKKP